MTFTQVSRANSTVLPNHVKGHSLPNIADYDGLDQLPHTHTLRAGLPFPSTSVPSLQCCLGEVQDIELLSAAILKGQGQLYTLMTLESIILNALGGEGIVPYVYTYATLQQIRLSSKVRGDPYCFTNVSPSVKRRCKSFLLSAEQKRYRASSLTLTPSQLAHLHPYYQNPLWGEV